MVGNSRIGKPLTLWMNESSADRAGLVLIRATLAVRLVDRIAVPLRVRKSPLNNLSLDGLARTNTLRRSNSVEAIG